MDRSAILRLLAVACCVIKSKIVVDRSAIQHTIATIREGAVEAETQSSGCGLMIGELFDPKAEHFVNDRIRPHWSQTGAIVFATIRTADSIPAEVLCRWEREKQEWMRHHVHIHSRGSLRDPTSGSGGSLRDPTSDRGAINDNSGAIANQHWSKILPLLEPRLRNEFNQHFNRCRETKLDECLGGCLLRRPELATIVAESLLHFDGERYRMGDFVVMPNHVHLLAAFASAEEMEKQFDSWLHYTAFRIHQRIGEKGHFWQQEPFDHLVRSDRQYEYLREYIERNPAKARLRRGEYLYRRHPS